MKNLKIHIAILGSITWLASFSIGEYALENGIVPLQMSASGYMIGFVAALGAHLIWEPLHGRWDSAFGNETPAERILSAFPLSIILSITVIGFMISVFKSPPWTYALSAAIGATVMAQGVIPWSRQIEGNHS